MFNWFGANYKRDEKKRIKWKLIFGPFADIQ